MIVKPNKDRRTAGSPAAPINGLVRQIKREPKPPREVRAKPRVMRGPSTQTRHTREG